MLRINRCGYNSSHSKNTRINSVTGSPDYLLLIIASNATIQVQDRFYTTGPNTLIIFDKKVPYNYGSIGETYSDDWVHFDIENEPILFESLDLSLNTPIPLPDLPVFGTLTTSLVNEFYSKSTLSQQNQDLYMRLLLNKLSEHIHMLPTSTQAHPHFAALNQLRIHILNEPYKKWKIENMAESLNISVSHFQHLYKTLFGISCINDVIGSRIAYARYHLKNTDLTIQQIAFQCGYENDVHFIRQFKKLVGVTPGQYRQNIPIDTQNNFNQSF